MTCYVSWAQMVVVAANTELLPLLLTRIAVRSLATWHTAKQACNLGSPVRPLSGCTHSQQRVVGSPMLLLLFLASNTLWWYGLGTFAAFKANGQWGLAVRLVRIKASCCLEVFFNISHQCQSFWTLKLNVTGAVSYKKKTNPCGIRSELKSLFICWLFKAVRFVMLGLCVQTSCIPSI